MPSTYSQSLRIELQADGENDSTWGDKTNFNLGTIIEAAIAGIVTVQMNDSDKTMTVNYGNTDEARNAMVVVTGNLSTQRNLVCPAVSKIYIIRNITSGGHGVQIKTQSGSGVVIENGDAAIVFCDGSNVIAAGSGSSNGNVTPQKLSSSLSQWTLTGSLGVNRSEAATSGFGRYAVDGTVGSEYNLYFKGTLIGKMGTEVTNGAATGMVLNTNGLPLALQVNGVDAMQVETDGTVDFAKTVTAAALVSTGSVTANGNVTAFSDVRYKQDWQPLRTKFVDRLAKIQSGTFAFKLNPDNRYAGVSAQDVKTLLPEAVEIDHQGRLSVAYGNLATVAVIELARDFIKLRDFGLQLIQTAHAMQERIEALEAKVK